MATEFDQSDELHYVGLYAATVVDNRDPLGLGRIKAHVPGILDKTGWAFPHGGTVGWFSVPDEGADITVFFHQGDPDVPFFATGHWGLVDGVPDTPGFATEAKGENSHKIKGFQTARFQMFFDERAGEETFKVLDRVTGDFISIDAAGITIDSKTKVTVNAPSASVNTTGDVEVVAGGSVTVDSSSINLGGAGLSALQGVVQGEAIDTFTGIAYAALGNASTVVKAKK